MAVGKMLLKLPQLELVGLDRAVCWSEGRWLSVSQCQQQHSEGARRKVPRKNGGEIIICSL